MKRKSFLLLLVFILFVSGVQKETLDAPPDGQDRYQPTIMSINTHECPEWFKDAKFGMFIDWGVYSVPGWAPQKKLDVSVKDRAGANQKKLMHKWEECRGIGQSYGYNRQATEKNFLDPEQLIDMLAEIVSQNGNLLLLVNLDGKGALMPENQKKRLKQIGEWLEVNGKAIYSTRPWLISHVGENIRFTQSKDGEYVYAICTDLSKDTVEIESVYLDEDARVEMLGTDVELEWSSEPHGTSSKILVEIPNSLEIPTKYAYVLKFEMR